MWTKIPRSLRAKAMYIGAAPWAPTHTAFYVRAKKWCFAIRIPFSGRKPTKYFPIVKTF